MAQKRDKVIILTIIGGGFFLFIIFTIFGIVLIGSEGSDFDLGKVGPKVAIVEVDGVIEKSEDIVRQLKKYQDDGSVKALVLRINSPGGGVAASQEIYDQLKKFRESEKYIVVSMSAVAASGGYYIACAADTIFANSGTITGSIGVIFSFPVFQNLMDKVGIKMEVIKSGNLKDVGNFAREISDEERRMLQSVIDDTYAQFVGVVADGRSLDTAYVKGLADGSIYTGDQALKLGLIDKIGTLDDAISKAGEMSDLGEHPRTIRERRYNPSLWEQLLGLLGVDLKQSVLANKWPTVEYRMNF